MKSMDESIFQLKLEIIYYEIKATRLNQHSGYGLARVCPYLAASYVIPWIINYDWWLYWRCFNGMGFFQDICFMEFVENNWVDCRWRWNFSVNSYCFVKFLYIPRDWREFFKLYIDGGKQAPSKRSTVYIASDVINL